MGSVIGQFDRYETIPYNLFNDKKGVIMRKYTIILDPEFEEGGNIITVPALPGYITQGETIEQCIKRAHEANEGYLESLEHL
ncbi:MAG: hypothetical protein NVS4B1_00640 [Ktedonobacteraceae bacterium]